MIEILTAAAVFGFSLGFSQEMAKDLRRMIRRHRRPFRMGPPIRIDEGLVQRGNGSGGPTTPKPEIVPGFHGPRRTVRWFINDPVQIAECGGPCTVGPTHCDCGALWLDVPTTWVDVPTTNQPPTDP